MLKRKCVTEILKEWYLGIARKKKCATDMILLVHYDDGTSTHHYIGSAHTSLGLIDCAKYRVISEIASTGCERTTDSSYKGAYDHD